MSHIKNNPRKTELSHYFNDLKKYKRLTKEEEKELGREILKGNKEAFNTLIEHNLRFVANVARKYCDCGVSYADLIGEGNMGLICAASRYDPEKGSGFTAYAVWWIKCYIKNFIRKRSNCNEIPIADCDESECCESLINEKFEENLNKLNDNKGTVADLLRCLKDREREIIRMSFGLDGYKELTLTEISKITDMSIERVRQLKDEAMVRLKCEVLSRSPKELNETRMLF